jgi:DNA polymerase IV
MNSTESLLFPVSHLRKILHLDLDAFYCAVEEQYQPHLKGIPFAVGGRPDQRGVVSSCSYAARRFGIHSAMPMSQAVRLCPPLVIVRPNFTAYRNASQQVMALLNNLTPFVEQISIDEAFLDVSLLHDDAEVIARQLQAAIQNELHLPCSLGVATNKLVAKMATNQGKAKVGKETYPNAILVVPPGEEAAFLAPLPIQELWGVGPKTAEHLIRLGIHTIGDVTRYSESELVTRFGKHGADLYQRAQGLDDRSVETETETKSISKETTFARDVRDGIVLKRHLRQLAEAVGRRLRQEGLQITTIKLKLRWSDFTTITRQTTLLQATDHDVDIVQAADELFDRVWMNGQAVRLIGVGVSGFGSASQQLGLWDQPQQENQTRLESTLDQLRNRFGDQAIRRASDLLEDE